MEIVIEISETLKKIADEGDIKTFSHFMWSVIVMDAIKNGTPLPKGHGRIIDESKIEVCEWVDAWEEDYPKASTDAPTIIEADGGGEDEEKVSD